MGYWSYVTNYASATDQIYTEMTSQMRIYPGGTLGPQLTLDLVAEPSKQDSSGGTAVGSMTAGVWNTNYPSLSDRGVITYTLRNKPTAIIYPFNAQSYTTTANPASLWEWAVGEQVLNDTTAYDVTAYFRFLQYDIDQSYNYVIQSPQLTR